MKNSFLWVILPGLLLASILLMTSCSKGDNPVSGDSSNQLTGNSNQQSILGEYTLSLKLDDFSAEINPVSRDVSFDVTRYVKINVLSFSWDAVTRTWDIDVSIDNPSNFAGYGVWAVFRNTGEQKILDQDGFTSWRISPGGYTKRVPLVAFAKPNPERIFYAKSTERGHIRIYWPPGTDTFEPMYFIIDASYPGPRQEPIVENLEVTPGPGQWMFYLTAYVKDWQTNPTTPPLSVYADITTVGGSYEAPMYDDGLHGDGAAGDDVYGLSFNSIADPTGSKLIVYAVDWENYMMENEIIIQ